MMEQDKVSLILGCFLVGISIGIVTLGLGLGLFLAMVDSAVEAVIQLLL
jgi:hypothetical protein